MASLLLVRLVHVSYGTLLVLSNQLGERDISRFFNDLVPSHEVERDFVSSRRLDVPILQVKLESAFFGWGYVLFVFPRLAGNV